MSKDLHGPCGAYRPSTTEDMCECGFPRDWHFGHGVDAHDKCQAELAAVKQENADLSKRIRELQGAVMRAEAGLRARDRRIAQIVEDIAGWLASSRHLQNKQIAVAIRAKFLEKPDAKDKQSAV